LTATNGAWTRSPTSRSHQWLRCNTSGGSCQPIGNATAQTYVLGAGDVGHTIRVQEWATNAGGTAGPATSVATAAVTVASRSGNPDSGPHGTPAHHTCSVPSLKHLTLREAKRALKHAHCHLGKVHRPRHVPRHHVLHVTKQSARPRTKHAANFPVAITVG
jgi:hypothetical protein